MKGVLVITTWLVVGIGSTVLAARQSTTAVMVLPESAPLRDVEIRWQSGGGDGCAGDCTNYRITVRGDGLVTLEDQGWGTKPPKAALRQRSIPPDNAVAFVNDLFKARFLEAPSAFAGPRVAVRKGDALSFYGTSVGVGLPWVDLTLRVGSSVKTVRITEETPQDLRAVERRIWEIGGPSAWPVR